MIAVTAAMALPMYALVNLALRPQSDPSQSLRPTTNPTLANFTQAWRIGGMQRAAINSILVTTISVLAVVSISAMAAYPLARATHRWSRLSFAIVMIGLLIPFQLGLLPLYKTMQQLGLIGSRWGLVLFYAGLQMPFATFLYTSFLRALPRDYEEAALLDGCSPAAAFWQVVLPLLRPVTGTVVVLNAVFIWNDFLTPLLYLGGSSQQTLPVAVSGFVGQYISNWPLVFAGLVIAMAPILLLYFVLQRHVIRGFTGGLK